MLLKKYYINRDNKTNPSEDNEVHTSSCHKLPSEIKREYLGMFSNGNEAVRAAKSRGYKKADGCKLCSPETHKS